MNKLSNSKYILTLVLIVALIISACSGGSGRTDVDSNYQKGSGVVDLEFQRNAPPSEVYADSQSSVVLKVTNGGSEYIDSGLLSIQTDRTFLDFRGDTQRSFSLQEAGVAYPRGESVIETLSFDVLSLEQESQEHDVDIIASFCYPYATRIAEEVCIDIDPFDTREDVAGCQLRDVSPGSSGAPVQVSDVSVRMSQDGQFITPSFVITIRHAGSGLLYDHNYVDSFCTDSVGEIPSNTVTFNAWLSDVELDCSASQIVLREKQAIITCRGETISTADIFSSYEAPLRVEMEYGYAVSESTRVHIKR